MRQHDEEEELAINHEDQDYYEDDYVDPRECDEAADRWERQFKDNFYR